jgi:hypothetical protein
MSSTNVFRNLMQSRGFLKCPRRFIKLLGLEKAVVLSELVDKQLYYSSNGKSMEGDWFFYTVGDLAEQLGIAYKSQRRIFLELEAQDRLIETSKFGSPPKRYIRVRMDEVSKLLEEYEEESFDSDPNFSLGNIPKREHSNLPTGEDSYKRLNGVRLSSPSPSEKAGDLRANLKRASKESKPLKITVKVLDAIYYWNSYKNLPHLKIPSPDESGKFPDPTVRLRHTVMFLERAFEGTLVAWPPLTTSQIKASIDNFHRAVTDTSVAPNDKTGIRKICMTDFLFCSFFPKKDAGDLQSMLIKYLEPPTKIGRERPKEKSSITTNELIVEFGRVVDLPEILDDAMEDKFVRAANRVVTFRTRLVKEGMTPVPSYKAICGWLVDAVSNQFSDPSVGNLDSDYTFDTLLPTHMEKIGRRVTDSEASSVGKSLYDPDRHYGAGPGSTNG